MPNYRRAFVPGGTYFFTVNLQNRQSMLLIEQIDALRSAWAETCSQRPVQTIAAVVLPDHLHFIWQLPEGDQDFPTRIRMIKTRFTRSLPMALKSKGRKGEANVWQRRYWEHCIRDEPDLLAHIDYVHDNPVKHGYVEDAFDWPYSTVRRFGEQDLAL